MSRLHTLSLVAAATLALSPAAFAASPASATLTPDARTQAFTGGPYVIPNVTSQTEITDVIGDPVCVPGTPVCDTFDIKFDLPEDFYEQSPQELVKFKMTWAATTGQEDYDFYLYDAAGNYVAQGEGTTNPETITFCAGQGVQDYTMHIIPWNALGATYTVEVELVSDPKARCKAPKGAAAPAEKSAGQFGGALGLGLLLPLLSLLALRRKRA